MSRFDVQHQDAACRLLELALKRDRVPHAYIFHGPDGVGKERAALNLAARLLKLPPEADTPEHPDVHLIHRMLIRYHQDPTIRRRSGRELVIDVVRDFLIEPAHLTPASAPAKMFIVREADLMTVSAQNALLKTLEEPPPRTFIVLLVERMEKLLDTIASRCQVVPFGRLPDSFVEAQLTRLVDGLAPEDVPFYVTMANGSIGAARSMTEQNLRDCADRLAEELINIGQGRRVPTRGWMDIAQDLAKWYRRQDSEITDLEARRRGLNTVFGLASCFYDDLLRAATAGSPPRYFGRRARDIARLADRMPAELCCQAIDRAALAGTHLDRNVNVELTVENLINDLLRLAQGHPLAA